MTTTVTIALATISLALAAAIATGVSIARSGRRLEARFRRSLREIAAEIEGLSEAFGSSAERLRRMTRVSDALAKIGAPAEPSAALYGLARAATTLCLADAAVVHGFDADGAPLAVAAGMVPPGVSGAIDWPGDDARVLTFALSYPDDQAGGAQLRIGVAVPFAHTGAVRGTIAVYWRNPSARTDDAIADLEALAGRVALFLGQEWRPARRQHIDRLTALGAREAFHATVSREVAHAYERGGDLSLVVLDVDDLRGVNRHVGHLASDAFLADVAARIRDVSGPDVEVCRIGGDEFGLILPRTSFGEAEVVCARVQEAMPNHPLEPLGRLALAAGIAEMRPDDDAMTLAVRADAALVEAKQRGKRSAAV